MEALIHSEGGFPLISLLDSYVVVSPMYIQLHKVFGLGVQNPIDNIWYEGQQVGVLHRHRIELLVILDKSQFPIFMKKTGEAIRDFEGRMQPLNRFSLRKSSSSFCSIGDIR